MNGKRGLDNNMSTHSGTSTSPAPNTDGVSTRKARQSRSILSGLRSGVTTGVNLGNSAKRVKKARTARAKDK